MTSRGRVLVLKNSVTMGKIFVASFGPRFENLFTLKTPWLDRRSSSSSSVLFGGTLYMTPLTSCSDLHSEQDITCSLTCVCWSRRVFCLFEVG